MIIAATIATVTTTIVIITIINFIIANFVSLTTTRAAQRCGLARTAPGRRHPGRP
jgi:hypothetical protein